MSVEQPVLWLGMAGFSQPQRDRLAMLFAARPEAWPRWQIGGFADADAWWIEGSHIRLLRDGTLKVNAVHPGERGVQLNLSEVDRPIAFSTPLANGEFEPMYTFDPSSEPSIGAILQQFEGWLRPLRAQFALAAQVIAREGELKSGVYHVSRKGALIAVIDLYEWQVGIGPTVRPLDFDDASWDKRPPAANDMPERFVRTSLTHLMWMYAQRTRRDVLPRRYRHGPIYFRRSPRVALRHLRDSHLLLLRELSTAPCDFDTLRKRSGLTSEALARDLAGLYFAGSITSTRANAASAARPFDDGSHSGRPSGLQRSHGDADSRLGHRSDSILPGDLTAPAPMSFD